MLNIVVLIGRLTRDPELRFTPNGKAVCQFSLAVDRPFIGADGEKQADFINIVVWGKPAESCARYLAKGKLAAVDGRLQIRSYTDNDGEKRWVTEVIARSVRFLSPADKQSEQNASAPAYDEEDAWADGEPWAGGDLPVAGDLPF